MYRYLILLVLAGCAGSPYFEMGVGYKVNTSYHLNHERGGRSPTGHIEIGMQYDNGLSCGINHWSHIRDGTPFNNRYESWKDEILCKKRWGKR